MKTFWLFRTNLRELEYYHSYTDLDEFKKKCHDFYLLQGIWFLENEVFDEVIIWRLLPKQLDFKADITFYVGKKRFVQRFVGDFSECLNHEPRPDVSFFRGGFHEYGTLTREGYAQLGIKLYCGTGKRVHPQYGGIYDKILVEDERDFSSSTIPFYKTANQNIFRPIDGLALKYDICWPCNFTQVEYKGQEWFIEQVAKSEYLKGLKILHVGNKPSVGKSLCLKYNVRNIEFAGHVPRPDLNALLNQSKMGLVTSNFNDGCPRVITEIICSGTPLIIRNHTRLLFAYFFDPDHLTTGKDIYFEQNCFAFNEKYSACAAKLNIEVEHLSMDAICKKNIELWGLVI